MKKKKLTGIKIKEKLTDTRNEKKKKAFKD